MTPIELMVLRKQHGLTQAEFGARLSPPVSRLTVCNWERARFAIPRDIALRMADLLAPPAQSASKPKNPKQDKAALEAYIKMRRNPGRLGSHAGIIELWHEHGFTPSLEAQQMIAEAFPDILKPTES